MSVDSMPDPRGSLADLPPGVLVHDWVEAIGGSENVLEALAAMLPGTDLVCTWMNAPERFSGRRIIETALARTPIRGRKALALPLSAATWRRVPDRGYQWALISSHAFAHHCRFVGQSEEMTKLVYVHSPARYIWDPDLDVRGSSPWVRLAARPLRTLDRKRASEATAIAANSGYVADRVRRHWHRDATVIHPPVEVSTIRSVRDWADELDESERQWLDALPAEFLLGASRLIPYKRLDRVITAGVVAGLPVVIAGEGPERASLTSYGAQTGGQVVFAGQVSTPLLRALYQRARCFVFPAVEDFGIMPVEAMAAGCPVVASSVGGTGETISSGLTGALVEDWENADELKAAIDTARGLARDRISHHALRFSAEQFAAHVEEWVRSRLR